MQYMLDHVGDTFAGVISGVTAPLVLFISTRYLYVEELAACQRPG